MTETTPGTNAGEPGSENREGREQASFAAGDALHDPAADASDGRSHTTGAGSTPAQRVMRSASEATPAERLPGPVDALGSDGDAQASGGAAITGLHETNEAETPTAEEIRKRGRL